MTNHQLTTAVVSLVTVVSSFRGPILEAQESARPKGPAPIKIERLGGKPTIPDMPRDNPVPAAAEIAGGQTLAARA